MCRFCENDLRSIDVVPQAICPPDQRIRMAQDKINILNKCVARTTADISKMKRHNYWITASRACVIVPCILLIFLFLFWLLSGAYVKCFIVFFIGACVCDALGYAFDSVYEDEKYDISDAEDCIAEDNAEILRLCWDIDDAQQEMAAQSYQSSSF